jgi:hypothetical protein
VRRIDFSVPPPFAANPCITEVNKAWHQHLHIIPDQTNEFIRTHSHNQYVHCFLGYELPKANSHSKDTCTQLRNESKN